MTLPAAFLTHPIAHRALHDKALGRIENSLSAIRAAIAAGYAIEVDVQLSSDGQAVVFHDDDLPRLTDATGRVRDHTAAALAQIGLRGGSDTIATLAQVCALVGGAVPLLVEIKDQDGALGPNVGPLERAVADVLADYAGPVAVMSFNPHSMAQMAELALNLPRGLTTCAFDPRDVAGMPEPQRQQLRDITMFDAVGASFISHHADDLDAAPVAALQARGVPVLCWTIRSPAQEAAARKVAVNVTFEGYLPPIPADT